MKYSKIAISGKICTGKTTLFYGLQKKLGWPVFSTGQYFRKYAKDNNLSLEKAEEQSAKLTKKVDFHVRELLQMTKPLLAEGWMTGIMANGKRGILKILLICDDRKRIQRFAKRGKTSTKLARKLLLERESNWLRKLSKIYDRSDFFDTKHYDLVIDTTNKTPRQILNQVAKKLGS